MLHRRLYGTAYYLVWLSVWKFFQDILKWKVQEAAYLGPKSIHVVTYSLDQTDTYKDWHKLQAFIDTYPIWVFVEANETVVQGKNREKSIWKLGYNTISDFKSALVV
jgi:hypothetical protein